jgi:hypothetical protein
MEIHFKPRKDILIIFCCDPIDINVITYKEIKDICVENKIEFKNQIYTRFITHLKNNFFDELCGRIQFTKVQRSTLNKQFKYKCNMCQCCTKDIKLNRPYYTVIRWRNK